MIKHQERIEQIAGILLVAIIVGGCLFVLSPFVLAILWAGILCLATWPLHVILIRLLKGRRTFSAVLMTLVLCLILLIPFALIALTFTETIRSGIEWLNVHKETTLPLPPAWIKRIPLAGTSLSDYWARLAGDVTPLFLRLKPWLEKAGTWLLLHSINFFHGIFLLAMSILLSFFFYCHGEVLVTSLRKAICKISGDYADSFIDVVKTTVQNVVYGMIGSALGHGIVSAIGFVIAGVPSPMLLALFTFFLSFLPAGPVLVWGGAAIYLFAKGSVGYGIFMVAYGVCVISMVDNFIKPYIISRGSKLPFIIMLIGVLGGLVVFGFIGVFLGPTLLAVGYSLAADILSPGSEQTPTRPANPP